MALGPDDSTKSAPKPRVLFLCCRLAATGGGEAVGAWMLQALAEDWDVTVVTWRPPDFAALDRMYGTSLAGQRFEFVIPNAAERWIIGQIPDDSDFHSPNYLARMAKRVRGDFVVRISCSVEADLGEPGIQYVHYPYFSRDVKNKGLTVPGDAPPAALLRGLLQGRVRPWTIISGFSFDRMCSNLTLTNSEWTRNEIRKLGGLHSEVLYPMAPGDFVNIPWQQRENGFVVVGRLHPMKRQDWIIDTLAAVRCEWPGLQLHICGFGLPGSSDYRKRIEKQVREQGGWVQIHENLPRQELLALAARQRYGIHACVEEHFGIAPAEMSRSGCIPFVHASGGQMEIVGGDPRLCYTTREDAVEKILAVLRDASLQHELQTSGYERSAQFAPEVFVRKLQERVRQFVREKNVRSSPGTK